jgi:hypothetical protein
MEDGLDFFGILCLERNKTIDMKRQKIQIFYGKIHIFYVFFHCIIKKGGYINKCDIKF